MYLHYSLSTLWRTTLICVLALFLIGCDHRGAVSKADIDSEKSQLKMLRISGLALSPTFEITQRHYVSTAEFNVSKMQLQTWAKQPGATIAINGIPATEITDHNLAVGNNEFTILVSAKDGSKEAYHLTVTRLTELSGL